MYRPSSMSFHCSKSYLPLRRWCSTDLSFIPNNAHIHTAAASYISSLTNSGNTHVTNKLHSSSTTRITSTSSTLFSSFASFSSISSSVMSSSSSSSSPPPSSTTSTTTTTITPTSTTPSSPSLKSSSSLRRVLQLEDKFAKLKERGRRKSRQAGVEETSHIVSRELLHSNILPKACGRGRVIANFGSRVMVQEIPWDDTLFSPQEGTIFPCLPRSKVKGLVCGDEVLWIPPSEAGDDATVEKMIERKCDFTRADSTGRHAVTLAANFDHMMIVCARKPATNAQLIDRYVAAAAKHGVGVTVIFNKMDMEIDEAIESDVMNFEEIGYRILRTSTVTGQGIEELRQHIATLKNGKPGTVVFLGQSGSGKSSLLNALVPGLDVRVNELSRNMQGRHTTTQAVMHHIPNGGGEIIDSPGFQNYVPLPTALNEVAAGFLEFVAPSTLCKYGSRCLHLHEPLCGVRSSVKGLTAPLTPEVAASIVEEAVQSRVTEMTNSANMDAEELAEYSGRVSPSTKMMRQGRKWRKKELSPMGGSAGAAVRSQQPVTGINSTTVQRLHDDMDRLMKQLLKQGSNTEQELELLKLVKRKGFHVSQRRYQSYVTLIRQMQHLEKQKFK